MRFILTREDYREDGIFSRLETENGRKIASCLEHSFDGKPKVAPGVYKAIRHSPNRFLYETFMLENVPNFNGHTVTGILLHIGNFNEDSDGCFLVGDKKLLPPAVSRAMVTDSKTSFARFMNLCIDELGNSLNEIEVEIK